MNLNAEYQGIDMTGGDDIYGMKDSVTLLMIVNKLFRY